MIEEYPLVSIAIITYNQKTYLRECIESCLAQDYRNFEIVVADDCSIDGTQDMLREYMTQYPDKFVLRLAEKNKGISENCNMAWKACKGKWIKFIAGDDKLKLNCLSIYINNIKASTTEADIYFASMQLFDLSNNYEKKITPDQSFFNLNSHEKINWLYFNGLTTPTAFIKKAILESVGYADSTYEMIEDHPLWLRLARNSCNFEYIDQVTVYYRVGDTTSQSLQRIGNIRFIESNFLFRKNEIWPFLPQKMFLKKIDDYAIYIQQKIGINYMGNRKSLFYLLLKIIVSPMRIYTIYNKIRNEI